VKGGYTGERHMRARFSRPTGRRTLLVTLVILVGATMARPLVTAQRRAGPIVGQAVPREAAPQPDVEAFAEAAARNPKLLPIVATVGARSVLKGSAKQMSPAARKKAVKDVKDAGKRLIAARGPASIRALPKIVRSAKKMSARKGTPPPLRTKVVKAAAYRVAASPSMTRRLARPSPRAVSAVRKSGMSKVGSRSFRIPGPARITITAA
jgi:hypothetical protein